MTDLVFSEFEGFASSLLKNPWLAGASEDKEDSWTETRQEPFNEDPFTSHLQAQLQTELYIETLLSQSRWILCTLGRPRGKGPEDWSENSRFFLGIWRGKEKKRTVLKSKKTSIPKKKESVCLDTVPSFQQNLEEKNFPGFLEGAGKTVVIRIVPLMSVKDFEQVVKAKLSLP